MKMINIGLIFITFLMLGGCGNDEGAGGSATQVVAKVNGEEITIHQLNQVLSRTRLSPRVTEEELKAKALQSLVDQTLLIQAAKKVKLDRDPAILSAMELAKRKVLVDAYMQKTLGEPTKASLTEVEALYSSRPELFSERKIYVYTKLVARLDRDKMDGLVEKIKDVDDLKELVSILDQENVSYERMIESKASEAIKPPFQKAIASLKVGDVGYMKLSDGLIAIAVQQKIDQPVSLKQATAVIERQIALKQQKEASMELLKGLKDTAVIEYVGDIKPTDEK